MAFLMAVHQVLKRTAAAVCNGMCLRAERTRRDERNFGLHEEVPQEVSKATTSFYEVGDVFLYSCTSVCILLKYCTHM